jgi:hypothetical protein
MYETFKKPDSNPFLNVFVTYDSDMYRLLEHAAELSAKVDSHGAEVIGLEIALLALVDFQPDIAFCHKLLDCGIQEFELLAFNK